MITNLTTIETISQSDLDQIPSKTLSRRFGNSNDSIELNIYDLNGNVLLNDEDFKDYTTYLNPSDSLVDSVDNDYKQVLNDYGFNNGKYKLLFSFQRKLITPGFERNFSISEISPSKTEIRCILPNLDTDDANNRINDLTTIIS